MENEILNSLCKLANMSCSEEEIDAVKICLSIFKIENRKNSNLLRMCEEVSSVIYKRELDLKNIYYSKSQY